MLCSPSGAPSTPEEVQSLQTLFDVRSHKRALDFVDSLFPSRHPFRHVLAWGVRRQFDRPHLQALLAHLGEADFLRPEELRQLEMPVQLIWGEAERTLPASHFAYFRRHLPAGAQIVRPPGFGHAPFLHRSRELAEMLLGFGDRAAGRWREPRDRREERLVAEE
jgi:pimeloyl-ACP methyl ester carboxylesterase